MQVLVLHHLKIEAFGRVRLDQGFMSSPSMAHTAITLASPRSRAQRSSQGPSATSGSFQFFTAGDEWHKAHLSDAAVSVFQSAEGVFAIIDCVCLTTFSVNCIVLTDPRRRR